MFEGQITHLKVTRFCDKHSETIITGYRILKEYLPDSHRIFIGISLDVHENSIGFSQDPRSISILLLLLSLLRRFSALVQLVHLRRISTLFSLNFWRFRLKFPEDSSHDYYGVLRSCRLTTTHRLSQEALIVYHITQIGFSHNSHRILLEFLQGIHKSARIPVRLSMYFQTSCSLFPQYIHNSQPRITCNLKIYTRDPGSTLIF